ncbi:MAG: O-antigen ligase family protein, partial [Methylococcales bacterium]|nr:O-antigen ligase family protein [Methylococcales bacterium]
SRTSRWPYLYFLLLIPAAIPLFFLVDFDRFTDQLSFILSGHLALVALSIFIWRQQFKRRQITRLLLYMIGPIICVATLTLYGTLTNQIVFTQESNFGTSAGFGPNQISNMLGLGAFIGTLLIVFLRRAPALRLIIGATTLVLMVQNALTFSRGGLFSFLLAVFAFILHVMHSRKARNWIAVGAVGLYLVGAFWLLPTLNDFTGGSIGQRFTDLDTSGRLEVAGGELQAFLDKPLTGVGVSLAASYRKAALGRIAPTHTEFTRLLGEHGLLGAVSGLMLLAVCWQQYRLAQSGITRALVAAFLIWSLSVMTQSALRFVAPVFILSLAMADWNFVKRHKTIQAPAETGS